MHVHQPELKYPTQVETAFVEAMAKVIDDTNQATLNNVAHVLAKPMALLSDVHTKVLLKEVLAGFRPAGN